MSTPYIIAAAVAGGLLFVVVVHALVHKVLRAKMDEGLVLQALEEFGAQGATAQEIASQAALSLERVVAVCGSSEAVVAEEQGCFRLRKHSATQEAQ